ncbi:hypothetical protein BU14_0741s0001 [Porphyra umbilicalis]|uniref:Uncharacterized protein n=1 Tax=Porphyra umbilicalis TaxID=2786 RepID=A0A1X6NPN4_PORUM|nr:hypothetical protein BU14_0741s0001 [Porphyra umbilicalis]|eukprot:OSX70490.1 hypothetical protein BU14_0741s0001 [Porphyra umbilicalis]
MIGQNRSTSAADSPGGVSRETTQLVLIVLTSAGVISPSRMRLHSAANTGSAPCRTLRCNKITVWKHRHTCTPRKRRRWRSSSAALPAFGGDPAVHSGVLTTGGSCFRSPQSTTDRPPKMTSGSPTCRSRFSISARKSALIMDSSSMMTSTTPMKNRTSDTVTFFCFSRSASLSREWMVDPSMLAAATPVGAAQTTLRARAQLSAKNRTASMTRDLPAPAVPPRYINSCPSAGVSSTTSATPRLPAGAGANPVSTSANARSPLAHCAASVFAHCPKARRCSVLSVNTSATTATERPGGGELRGVKPAASARVAAATSVPPRRRPSASSCSASSRSTVTSGRGLALNGAPSPSVPSGAAATRIASPSHVRRASHAACRAASSSLADGPPPLTMAPRAAAATRSSSGSAKPSPSMAFSGASEAAATPQIAAVPPVWTCATALTRPRDSARMQTNPRRGSISAPPSSIASPATKSSGAPPTPSPLSTSAPSAASGSMEMPPSNPPPSSSEEPPKPPTPLSTAASLGAPSFAPSTSAAGGTRRFLSPPSCHA